MLRHGAVPRDLTNNITVLTLSVPVSYQEPTSPYITHTKYDIW